VFGVTGDTCNIVGIHECASNPCLNGGTCADGLFSYVCECLAGTEGTHCETDLDECASNPCLNGGTCTHGINSFVCDCPRRFTGDACDELAPVPTAPTGLSAAEIGYIAGGIAGGLAVLGIVAAAASGGTFASLLGVGASVGAVVAPGSASTVATAPVAAASMGHHYPIHVEEKQPLMYRTRY
jgi:hypothetical protein